MIRKRIFLFLFLFCITGPYALASHQSIHHKLTVKLNPSNSIASFHDIVTIPLELAKSGISFRLNKNATIKQLELSNGEIYIKDSGDGLLKFDLPELDKKTLSGPLKLICFYNLPLPSSDTNIETLHFSGTDYFYPQAWTKDKVISSVTFQIKIQTPRNIKVVSQGKKLKELVTKKTRTTIWKEEKPQEEIILIADSYHEFFERHDSIKLYVYLLKNDYALAKQYFEATKLYLDFYSSLLAPYPYKKFAMIENSQQTGYGMPSFTLLGSRVIRLPFILHTSYPHEILHNWLGNGVYIDSNSGNWAEGLTTYLADHLLAEQKGKGASYRFQELIRYSSYVNEKNDFPLVKFKQRNNMSSQAIGYGKMLMVLHMLRLKVGDINFLEGLRDFYNENKFHKAGFNELRASFERKSKIDLKHFFDQWALRKGAPLIQISSASYSKQNNNYLLQFKIRQIQTGLAFKFKIPTAVWLKNQKTPWIGKINVEKKEEIASITFASKPQKILLDPYHEVFRRLNADESPPNIGKAFSSKKTNISSTKK